MVRDALQTLGWPDWILELYLLNPITQAVELFHFAFWNPVTTTTLPLPPDLAINTLWTFLISVTVLIIGQSVFRRLEGRFAQDL
jgi:ABC-2 type transport system permease protein